MVAATVAASDAANDATSATAAATASAASAAAAATTVNPTNAAILVMFCNYIQSLCQFALSMFLACCCCYCYPATFDSANVLQINSVPLHFLWFLPAAVATAILLLLILLMFYK